MKNGKKICWNYRKGRCRFGSNCTYAHDSDLHVSEPDKELQQTTNSNSGVSLTPSIGTTLTSKTKTNHNNNNNSSSNNSKKRSGLGDSIVPSKKVIKAYNALKK